MLGRVTTCIWSLFLIEAVEINLVIQEAECISLADLLFFPSSITLEVHSEVTKSAAAHKLVGIS